MEQMMAQELSQAPQQEFEAYELLARCWVKGTFVLVFLSSVASNVRG